MVFDDQPVGLNEVPVLKDVLEFGRAEILAIGCHQRQGLQPVAHVWLGTGHQAVPQHGQASAQFGGLRDLLVQRADLLPDDAFGGHAVTRQQRPDVAER